ncbi:hypothetical protein L6R46_21440 [Myxococcota bacterium]|nr:hypothetical protein [Myxococcota bacterium]
MTGLLWALSVAWADEPVERAAPPPIEPWAQLGAGLELRPRAEAAEFIALRAGLEAQSSLRLGVEVSWAPPRALDRLGELRGYSAVSVSAGGWWWAGGAWSPGLGCVVELSTRSFYGAEGLVHRALLPALGVEASVAVPLGERAAIVPSARLTTDLRRVELRVDGQPVELMSPWGLQGSLTVLIPRVELP